MQLLKKEDFRRTIDKKEVSLYTLKNSQGTVCQITNFGGKVVSLYVPDKKGNYEDVVLGFANLDGFLTAKEKYFGALVGRYGNRIANGKFTLDGQEYTLAINNTPNHLHGGDKGLDAVVWDARQIDSQTLQLTYLSAHMEEGYPGNLSIKVKYHLNNNNELKIEYWATTDRPTVANMTHHSFFNLKGAGNGDIEDHLIQINASHYTPVNENMVPTGEIAPVKNTPFDFQKLTRIGVRINADFDQLIYGSGYDHNYVFGQRAKSLHYAAKVIEPVSGRTMEVFTNEVGMQFYTGNFLDGSAIGKEDKMYKSRSAFCLETQHFPDSPNQPHFPSTRLDPGETYYSICIYRFSVE